LLNNRYFGMEDSAKVKLVEEKLFSLLTRDGFVNAFWRDLNVRRAQDPNTTQRQVFESLDALYFKEIGHHQFPSFESFRMYRDRRYKSGKK